MASIKCYIFNEIEQSFSELRKLCFFDRREFQGKRRDLRKL